MAKHIMQYRYYGEKNDNNQPSEISIDNLVDGTIFNDLTFTQLGIQALPGTRFYLNNNLLEGPILIGSTGIYELDLEGISSISSIKFKKESLEQIQSATAGLIIDVIYEK